MIIKTIAAAAALFVFPAIATAQVGDIGNVVDKRCVNGKVQVGGMGNVITVTGYCPLAIVKGTGNVLNIDRVGQIQVSGTGNVVEYRYLNSNPKNPKLKVHPTKNGGGLGNTISWTKGAAFDADDSSEE